jgi:hypothetical protein
VAAAASATVSALAAFFAWRIAVAERQRWRLDLIDRRTANISLELRSGIGRLLVIRNEGPAPLTGLRLSADAEQKAFIDVDMLRDVWPLELQPLQRFELPVVVGTPHPRYAVIRVRATWRDGTGERSQVVPVAIAVDS